MPFIEKRKHKRICPVPPLEVKIYIEDESLNEKTGKGQGIISLYTNDISLGGIFLKSSVRFKIGSTIHLNLRLPLSDNPIHIIGKIIRNSFDNNDSALGVGIEFERINFDDKNLLQQYIESNIIIAKEIEDLKPPNL